MPPVESSKPWIDIASRLDVLSYYGSMGIELRQSGSGFVGKCPFHDDHHASLSVSNEDGKRGLFFCHACNEKGSSFDLYQKVRSTDFPTALRAVAPYANVTIQDTRPLSSRAAGRTIVATYEYTDEDGNVAHRTVRTDPKGFYQQRFEGGSWITGLKSTTPLFLYHAPEVASARRDGKTIYIVEGEKDADALRMLTVATVTTSPMGAGKWRASFTEALAGADVVLLPDNDEAGRKHMQMVAGHLHGEGCRVRMLELPGLAPKGDVSDWIAAGGEASDLAFLLVTKGREWKPIVKGPELVVMDTVVPEDVEWVWEQHIPRGKLSLIVGDPGLGKSTIALDMATRVSKGLTWPDKGNAPKGRVLILMAEDGLADTVVPRLVRLGADRTQIIAMTGVLDEKGESRYFTFDKDLEHVAAAIEETQPVLVIIDPLNAYLGDIDAHQDASVRRILNPIGALADRFHTAIVCVMHLNKNTQTKADYRVGGSIAYTAAARSVSFVVSDKEEEDRRIFITHKMNLARKPPALAFRLNGSVEWELDPVKDADIEDLLVSRGNAPEGGQLEDAAEFLKMELSGGEVLSSTVLKNAHEMGISPATLKRAKSYVEGIYSRKVGEKWFMGIRDPRVSAVSLDPSIKDGVKEVKEGDQEDPSDIHDLLDTHDPLDPLPLFEAGEGDQEGQGDQEDQEYRRGGFDPLHGTDLTGGVDSGPGLPQRPEDKEPPEDPREPWWTKD